MYPSRAVSLLRDGRFCTFGARVLNRVFLTLVGGQNLGFVFTNIMPDDTRTGRS